MTYGPNLNSEETSQVTAEAVSDLYPHSAEPAPSYSNMEDVD